MACRINVPGHLVVDVVDRVLLHLQTRVPVELEVGEPGPLTIHTPMGLRALHPIVVNQKLRAVEVEADCNTPSAVTFTKVMSRNAKGKNMGGRLPDTPTFPANQASMSEINPASRRRKFSWVICLDRVNMEYAA